MPTTRSQTSQATGSTTASSSENPTANSTTRSRAQLSTQSFTNDVSSPSRRTLNTGPDHPPRFTINLSLPPSERYHAVCDALAPEITGLTSLFDEVVGGGILPFLPLSLLHWLCWALLRRVYDDEETAELRGISARTGVSVYLLVCFNVLLDLFMGCSSGGAATEDGMLQFRTLDWGMPALRRVVVILDFVTEEGGEVVASSVTYAGYVGVLTGVRRELSVSLNFRARRDGNGVWGEDVRYALHLALVVLGWRRGISSVLMGVVVPKWMERCGGWGWEMGGYRQVVERFGRGGESSTVCYLCVSDGVQTTVIEKDRVTARMRRSREFIVVTNGDQEDETTDAPGPETPLMAEALQELLHDARDRKECAENNWHNMRIARLRETKLSDKSSQLAPPSLMTTADVIALVQKFPTTNECTHYACVLSALSGDILWCRRWKRSISAKWTREHMSEGW